MTADLTTARTGAVSLLTAASIRAVANVPQTFTPPIVWITAGVPFRQRAQAVGRKRINLVALCLGGLTTNDATEAATEELAELVADTIDKSTTYRLDPVSELDQPRMYPTAQNQQMLGIAVNFWCEATRG